MRLSELVQGLTLIDLHGDTEVYNLQVDSRQVQPNTLFVAIKGTRHDGHQFVADALARGACGVVVSERSAIPSDASAWVVVPDTREALWKLAQRLYRHPSAHLTVVGVTGTNGKTTTTHYLQKILATAGLPTLLIGTLGAYLETPEGERTPFGEPLDFTTPEIYQLQQLIAQAQQQGMKAVVMEVSSHALDQKRTDGIAFDGGVFTNLTQDHLDYHHTMEAYAQAKLRLFTDLVRQSEKPYRAVICLDTEWGAWFAERAEGMLWTYGTIPDARVRATDALFHSAGIEFTVRWDGAPFRVQTQLPAPYNLHNALGAITAALSLGIDPEAVQEGVARLERVPGRFERVPIQAPFEVFVDFAHTPDALQRVLETARRMNPTRLTVVFGCGGDRDPHKRPRMGAIAEQLADRIVLTSDNPRTEDPHAILRDIQSGLTGKPGTAVIVELDRRQAIYSALATAQPGEIILLAGKGHESYQIIGTTKYPFSDREVVLDFFRSQNLHQEEGAKQR